MEKQLNSFIQHLTGISVLIPQVFKNIYTARITGAAHRNIFLHLLEAIAVVIEWGRGNKSKVRTKI